MNENDTKLNDLFLSILKRINLIYLCLPNDLRDNIIYVKNNIIDLMDNNIKFDNNDTLVFLDKVSLYSILSKINLELNMCLLLSLDNSKIKTSIDYVNIIMESMANYDSVFRYCYKKNRVRVL